MSALRDRIVEIRSRPTTADIGVKALVKKLKDEFGEDVNTKTVRQHLEETEKASAPQTAPTNVTAVSPTSSASPSNGRGTLRILSSGDTLHRRDLIKWPKHQTIKAKRVVASTTDPQLLRDKHFDTIVHQFFDSFATAERTFLLHLSPADRHNLKVEDDPSWAPAAHFRSHIEVLMTLKGLKPCTLYAFFHDEGMLVFDRLVRTCLLPLMSHYRLEEYGFVLQKIDHDIPTTSHKGFRDGWIFGDTRSGLWSHAKDVFLTPHPDCVRSEADVGLALGYPVRDLGRKGTVKIWYKDATEQEELRKATGEDVCCVDAFEFWAHDERETCDMITIHIIIAMRIAMSVGRKLKVDFGHHPGAQHVYVEYVEKLARRGPMKSSSDVETIMGTLVLI